MMRAIEWLLGLDRIRLNDGAPLTLRFDTTPAPWIMLFGAIIAAVFVFRTYRRRRVASRWRWLLMPLRFGVIMSVLFVIGRPVLVLQKNEIEPSVVAVLLDTSLSMTTIDGIATTGGGDDLSAVNGGSIGSRAVQEKRWRQATSALFDDRVGLVGPLLDRHEVEFWTFDATASRLGQVRTPDDVMPVRERIESLTPAGRLTNVTAAVSQVLDAMQGRRLAGVILLTDGRQTAQSGLETALRASDARLIPIHAVAVGSARPRRDIEIVRVHAAEHVFVSDTVGVDVQMELKGFDTRIPVRVELQDRDSGEVVAQFERTLDAGETAFRGRLVYRPMTSGLKRLIAQVAPTPGEENIENNAAALALTAHDARVSVLFIDDAPRYEYRFLKNVLLREPTIDSSCLLLSATPGFTQEGTRPIAQFPRSVEELNQYDVIILGDVDPRGDWISPVQESMLVDFVSHAGGGLAFVAGERNMPDALRRTRLEKLLPVRLETAIVRQADDVITDAWRPRLTVEGQDHVIFAMDDVADGSAQMPAALPGWYWHASVAGPQPGAVVLATLPADQRARDETPLAVLGRFGKGRTFYLGSDDLWRWRQYEGESYYNHVWVQIIRTLARGRKFGERGLRLETDRRRYDLGRAVRVELSDESDSGVSLPVAPTVMVRDERDQPIMRVELRRDGRGANRAIGEFTPTRSGQLTLTLENDGRGTSPPARVISVVHVDRERDLIESDPVFLEMLASGSGGISMPLGGDWQRLTRAIPDRSIQIPADVEESVWDTRLMLIVFFVLIASEWIIRKGIGLV